MTDTTAPTSGLVAHLERLVERDDRGALADLRRSLTRPAGQAVEAYPHVYPYLPNDIRPFEEDAYFEVAGLFALLQQGAAHPLQFSGSFGASMHRLRAHIGNDDAVDRRFRALLDADRAAVGTHLRHATTQLRGATIGVDWTRLLGDLKNWDHPARFVQRRWARDYWHADISTTTLET